MKIWVKQIADDKIVDQRTQDITGEIESEKKLMDQLQPLLAGMNVALPVILQKHVRQIVKFKKTSFSKADNIEEVAYDRLDVELFDENNEPKYNKLFE